MLIVDSLYKKDYDSTPECMPEKTYMVASIPRSGSTHFVLRLWSAGVFGAPLEYLNQNTNRHAYRRLGNGSLAEYWNALLPRRTSSNGIFGFKMFIRNYKDISKAEPQFLPLITPDHVIYFTRKDKAAQAVSYARALQTNRWFAVAKEQKSPVYSFENICKQELSIVKQEGEWERIFALTGGSPLRVEYSELLQDEAAVMKKIASHLDVTLDEKLAVDIGVLDKQSDNLNKEWLERYLVEKRERGME